MNILCLLTANQRFGNPESICLEGMKQLVQTEQKKQLQIPSYERIGDGFPTMEKKKYHE